MIKQIFTLLILSLLCISASAQKKDESKKDSNSGIIHARNHAFTLTAPKGWVFDSKGGVSLGFQVVFYPQNSSWPDTASMMYTTFWEKQSAKQTAKEMIDSDIADFKKKSPNLVNKNESDLIVQDAKVITLGNGKTATVKYFFRKAYLSNDDAKALPQAIAYINEEKVVVLIVLKSNTKKDFESSLSAFQELVGSYQL